MPKKRYLEAGEIVGTHGVRGEVRVYPECDSPAVLEKLKKLYFDNGARAVRIKARAHKNIALIKLEGVDTVEAAAALRGQMLYLDRNDLKLPRGTYFIADLIGLSVVDDDTGEVYGECTDVSQTGSNDVYHLRTNEGREVLIPAIPSVVRRVDIDGGEIRIFRMLGLFDDEN